MDAVEIEQVDDRDSSWGQPEPRFRVYLHGSAESSTAGWTDTSDITGADVVQVIAGSAAGRSLQRSPGGRNG